MFFAIARCYVHKKYGTNAPSTDAQKVHVARAFSLAAALDILAALGIVLTVGLYQWVHEKNVLSTTSRVITPLVIVYAFTALVLYVHAMRTKHPSLGYRSYCEVALSL